MSASRPTGGVLLLALLAVLLGLALAPRSQAAPLNLAMSCNKYENEILPAAGSESSGEARGADAINTVMWLFGYSTARAGEHVMYGDALTSFGFALDAACKSQPSMSLFEALSLVTPKKDKPMNLDNLTCESFETRHAQSEKSDPDSAGTIMMWLFGFSVGRAGGHFFEASHAERFANSLKAECARRPLESLYDALGAVGTEASRL